MSTSKGIYLGGTLLSILLSLYLYTSGRRETAIFVGLWAPTLLNLGQTLLERDAKASAERLPWWKRLLTPWPPTLRPRLSNPWPPTVRRLMANMEDPWPEV